MIFICYLFLFGAAIFATESQLPLISWGCFLLLVLSQPKWGHSPLYLDFLQALQARREAAVRSRVLLKIPVQLSKVTYNLTTPHLCSQVS